MGLCTYWYFSNRIFFDLRFKRIKINIKAERQNDDTLCQLLQVLKIKKGIYSYDEKMPFLD
jgi:hypothetical protein